MKDFFKIIIFSSILFLGCSSDNNNVIDRLKDDGLILEDDEVEVFLQESPSNTNQVLSGIASGITNWYEDFSNQTSSLYQSIDRLCENPDNDKLTQAQSAWRDAKLSFNKTELISFGPVNRQEYIGHFNFWPTRIGDIETAIRNNNEFTLEIFDNLSGRIRGLPALEYLLFGENNDNDEILNNLEAKRCSFIKFSAKRLELDAIAVASAWSANGENFSEEFSNAGQGSESFETISSAINEIVNQMGSLIEIVKDNKLSKPLGLSSGGSENRTLLESYRSGYSQESILSNLNGLKEFYTGSFQNDGSTSSFYSYVNFRNTGLANEIADLIDRSIDQASLISTPLSQNIELQNTQNQIELAIDSLRDLQNLISGQLSSELGVTIFFNDNDGD